MHASKRFDIDGKYISAVLELPEALLLNTYVDKCYLKTADQEDPFIYMLRLNYRMCLILAVLEPVSTLKLGACLLNNAMLCKVIVRTDSRSRSENSLTSGTIILWG